MMRISEDEARQRGWTTDKAKRLKYGNVRTAVDGIVFDSAKEARRWRELRNAQELMGTICRLERQPRFALVVNGVKCADYVGDFRYVITRNGEVVTEDCKGFLTPVYRLKRKLVAAIHGFEIQEI